MMLCKHYQCEARSGNLQLAGWPSFQTVIEELKELDDGANSLIAMPDALKAASTNERMHRAHQLLAAAVASHYGIILFVL